ncbi:MAG: hypothetical protein WBP93_13810 [Pyrinomonadaceae bacterium]
MSVIGRLDQQVEDALISPIEKRDKQQTIDDDAQTETDKRAHTQTHTQSISESSKNRRAELPVWLL